MPGILLRRGRAYPNLTSPDTNFRSNSGWVVAPLWFPNSSALIRLAVLSSSVMGSVGHCDPWASISFIRFQSGWFLRRERSNSPFWNPDPYPIGDLACVANAFSNSKLNFRRTRKFDSAAASFISKRFGSLTRRLHNDCNDLHHVFGPDFWRCIAFAAGCVLVRIFLMMPVCPPP